MRPRRLFTIAPDARFLDVLAMRVLDGTLLHDWPREGPFWLADVTVILPTRRARLALAEAFARQLRGATLLPDIRTFGGEEATEEEPFLPPADAPPLPPPVGRLERRLTLARLTAGFLPDANGREILALADSLADVIDEMTIMGLDARALRSIAPEELAANWQDTLRFLNVALEAWPQVLADRGKAEAAALRNLRLKRQAETLPQLYSDRPVIAAGSTGSIPATAALLGAIADLPRGAVVLPGLDTTLSADDFAALLEPAGQPHGHPQYGLARLLRLLGARPDVVEDLAPEPRPARTIVVRTAMALAEDTARWASERAEIASQLDAAGDGLSILAARAEEGEARAIALAVRDAVASGHTAGIVTPDRNLARRIAAELLRFGIEVDDAAGTPLFQSGAGRLARQVLAVAMNDYAAVDLVALLHNRAVGLGMERAELLRFADMLDLRLRGALIRPGLVGLRELLKDTPSLVVVDRMEAGLEPLTALLDKGNPRAGQLAEALLASIEAIATTELPGGSELVQWADELMSLGGEGPVFPPVGLDAVLAGLMAGFTVRSPISRRDDVFIWGTLEARLQSPDLMILAGLNEEIWPQAADPGPWLNRRMRLAAGLEPPERWHGLAAHDFAMALGRSEVIIAYAERLGTSPAAPSRLVQRLEAFLGAEVADKARARGQRWISDARRIDETGQRPRAARRPLPRPPAMVRPKELSITEIERLFRSPYDIYARRVLQLKAIDPLGQVPGGRERGSLIHDVFARFIIEGHAFDSSALHRLVEMAKDSFDRLEAIRDRRDIWLRRFAVAAQLFLEFERERDTRVSERHAEIKGEWTFPSGFRLVGRADRVDVLADGTLEIIDFKTGSVPEPKQMKAFEAPQLLLEAAMARAVGIGPVEPATVSALTYIKVGSGASAYRPRAFTPRDDDLPGAIGEAERRLQRHVAEFLLKDTLPLAARIIPDAKQRFRGEFDHLARTEEWLVQEDEDY